MIDLRNFFGNHDFKLPAERAALVVGAAFFVVGLIISSLFANMISRQGSSDYEARLYQQKSALNSTIAQTIEGYNQLLLSGAAFWNANGDVSKASWNQYYTDMRIDTILPGTLGYGYAAVIPSTDSVAPYEAQMREAGIDDIFTVHPAGVRDTYTAITYLEPTSEANTAALGYDMFSEPSRREAMAMARDNAEVAMSQPVRLIQSETDGSPYNGILMYYPVYHGGTIPDSVAERRARIRGYVYVVMRPGDVFARAISGDMMSAKNTASMITDVTTSTPVNVYARGEADISGKALQTVIETRDVDNRRWEVKLTGWNTSPAVSTVPMVVMLLGTMLSFLVAVFVIRHMLQRIAHVGAIYEAEVERTKDELLALASHQLRTPASGVKQYVGILTSGIVGELTPAQQQIAEKAYNTNERQIEIINELLYVSKIEAGKVVLNPHRSDIVAITHRIIDASKSHAERKDMKISFRSKTARYVWADEQYYPMIIENLLNNAIKYSYPGSTVSVRLSDEKEYLLIAITDRGVGISREDQARLFKKFDRIENPLSRSEGGSGLGLFLAYQLARAHGGDVRVTSVPEKGSTFTLVLPKHGFEGKVSVDIMSPGDR